MFVLSVLIVTLLVAMEMLAGQSGASDLDLTPITDHFGKNVKCTTKKGKEGQCVNELYCNEEHVILPGGDIHDVDLREKRVCVNLEWCCSVELLNTPTISLASPNDRCLATDDDESSWTVSLHKFPSENPQSAYLFCAGVLISSNVVLTAATCVRSARSHNLYIHVPASPVKKNYTVKYRIAHKNYNTGTHLHDFGILVLDEKVEWGREKQRTACLDFTTKLEGDCLALGFNSDFEITTTLLTVEQKSCLPHQNIGDVCCGKNYNELDPCIITTGAPVLCRSRDNVMTVVGIARSVCNSRGEVPIGELVSVKTWLQTELETIKLPQSVYTYRKL